MPQINLNYQNVLEINITPGGASATWARICKGFANLAEAINEVLYQGTYLCDGGWGSTEVTGGQWTLTLTGVRYFADQAQDWIFSDDVMYQFGDNRKTQLRITRGNQAILQWDVTLANITISGGDSNQPAAISLTIHGNGAPQLLTNAYLQPLTVVSVPGTTTGNTAVYVNPSLESGHTYKYAINQNLPAYDQDLTTWAAWDGTAEITAATGTTIVIAEVDSGNLAKKGGRATVTADDAA